MKKPIILNDLDLASDYKLRLVYEGGNKICTYEEAIKEAEEKKLKILVLNNPKNESELLLCKLIDLNKYISENIKKKKAKPSVIKEISFKINIGLLDLDRKIKQTREFLLKKIKVILTIQVKGKNNNDIFREKAVEFLNLIFEKLQDISNKENNIDSKGSNIKLSLIPIKK